MQFLTLLVLMLLKIGACYVCHCTSTDVSYGSLLLLARKLLPTLPATIINPITLRHQGIRTCFSFCIQKAQCCLSNTALVNNDHDKINFWPSPRISSWRSHAQMHWSHNHFSSYLTPTFSLLNGALSHSTRISCQIHNMVLNNMYNPLVNTFGK